MFAHYYYYEEKDLSNIISGWSWQLQGADIATITFYAGSDNHPILFTEANKASVRTDKKWKSTFSPALLIYCPSSSFLAGALFVHFLSVL